MVLLTNFAKISQNRPIFGTKLTRPPKISWNDWIQFSFRDYLKFRVLEPRYCNIESWYFELGQLPLKRFLYVSKFFRFSEFFGIVPTKVSPRPGLLDSWSRNHIIFIPDYLLTTWWILYESVGENLNELVQYYAWVSNFEVIIRVQDSKIWDNAESLLFWTTSWSFIVWLWYCVVSIISRLNSEVFAMHNFWISNFH